MHNTAALIAELDGAHLFGVIPLLSMGEPIRTRATSHAAAISGSSARWPCRGLSRVLYMYY